METIETHPKKGSRIVKTVIASLLLIAIVGITSYFVYSNLTWNPALIVHISTGVNESSSAHIITNVTFEQSEVIYKGTEAVPTYPEIDIMVRKGSLLSSPVSYWAAVPWDSEESSGNYTLTIIFRETYTPSIGDILIITIKQVSVNGRIMNKQTAFYTWE